MFKYYTKICILNIYFHLFPPYFADPVKNKTVMTQKTFNCIAVDMGAASIRIMQGTIAKGRLTYEEKHRFNNEIKTVDGHERWNIDLITTEIKKGIALALAESPNPVQSIAVD